MIFIVIILGVNGSLLLPLSNVHLTFKKFLQHCFLNVIFNFNNVLTRILIPVYPYQEFLLVKHVKKKKVFFSTAHNNFFVRH